MKAGDVMTSAVISATADTPVWDMGYGLHYLRNDYINQRALTKRRSPGGTQARLPSATLGASGGSRCYSGMLLDLNYTRHY